MRLDQPAFNRHRFNAEKLIVFKSLEQLSASDPQYTTASGSGGDAIQVEWRILRQKDHSACNHGFAPPLLPRYRGHFR